MTRYLTTAQAEADGFTFEHEPEKHRFVLAKDGKQLGEAHYTLLGDFGIDFDHTLVDPELRGTGISGLLAERAVTAEVTKGRRIQASCWFIEGYLERHPELRAG